MMSKNVYNSSLRMFLFSNTPTFTLIVLVLQITNILGMKNPGTLASHSCTEDPLLCIKVIDAAFLLIVIMLQTKFLFVRVHHLAFSNIL